MDIIKYRETPDSPWKSIPALKGDKGDKGDPGESASVDLSAYAKTADVEAELATKADKQHEHTQYLTEHQSLEGYATEQYVDDAVSGITVTGGGVGQAGTGTGAEIFNCYKNTSGVYGKNVASGIYSHAEGWNNKASGSDSHAEGASCEASGDYSHAEGYGCDATGSYSHAEGRFSIASGETSHAEGYCCKAQQRCSHAEGIETVASSPYQHVQGKANIEDTEGKYAHIVGNGNAGEFNMTRSNAHTLDWDGNAWYAGTVEGTALILSSPNGTRYQITVSDTGSLSAAAL